MNTFFHIVKILVLIQVALFNQNSVAAQFVSKDYVWKSVIISGDDSIPNFDRAREHLSSMIDSFGVHHRDQRHLTSDRKLAIKDVGLATKQIMGSAFDSLKVGPNDACFVFMTSHGSRGRGFYLKQDQMLAPSELANMVQKACGNNPTVILVSACYSGQFVEALKGSNRIVLTAAREDRTSFGCSADVKYTYWDGCLIDELKDANSWNDLYARVKTCIEKKEAGLHTPSLPQAYFGENMNDLEIFHK